MLLYLHSLLKLHHLFVKCTMYHFWLCRLWDNLFIWGRATGLEHVKSEGSSQLWVSLHTGVYSRPIGRETKAHVQFVFCFHIRQLVSRSAGMQPGSELWAPLLKVTGKQKMWLISRWTLFMQIRPRVNQNPIKNASSTTQLGHWTCSVCAQHWDQWWTSDCVRDVFTAVSV